MTIKKKELISEILSLGIKRGDVLFLRISYRSLGKLENGPKDIIDSLLEVIGKEGTIVVATYPKLKPTRLKWLYKDYIYDRNHPPKVYTGAIASTILEYSDVYCSENPTVMFSAVGKLAKTLTDNYTIEKKPYFILRDMVENYNAKCLRVGGQTLTGTTHLALSDAFKYYKTYQRKVHSGINVFDKEGNKKWIDTRNNSVFCYKMFNIFYESKLRKSTNVVISEGRLGLGLATLTSMKITYENERKYFLDDINNILCDDDNCLTCRVSYGFSKTNNFLFLFRQMINVFYKKNRKSSLNNIKKYFQIYILGTKCH